MLVNMHTSPRLFYFNVLMDHNTLTAADFGDGGFFGSNTKFVQGDRRYQHDRGVRK